MAKHNVAIQEESINQVKIAIAGTTYKSLGEFYAIAAAEKIEKENLKSWVEKPKATEEPNY